MPPTDSNVTPEQAAAREEAMKRIEEFGGIQTIPSNQSNSEQPTNDPNLATAANEVAAQPADQTVTVNVPPTPNVADPIVSELPNTPTETSPKPSPTTASPNISTPLPKGNQTLPDEISLVSNLSEYIFSNKISRYRKAAIAVGVLVALYLLIRIISFFAGHA